MYRTHYDLKAGCWRVQLQVFGFLWQSVCDAGKPRGWPNYEATQEFIQNVGLDKVYRRYEDSPAHHIMTSAQPYYPPQVLRTPRAA